jgi:hypothetical protein
MPRINNSQNVQITGSSSVSIGSIEQTVGAEPVDDCEASASSRRLRVLFMAANPAGTVPLSLDREAQAIDQALTAAGSRDRFEVEQIWLASPADLQRGLLRFNPQILHFAGHGEEGRLIFESFSSTLLPLGAYIENPEEPVPAHNLARIIALAADKIRCVLLNACFSEATAEEIAKYVSFVIGVPAELKDAAAIQFAWSFYHALGTHKSIRTAFDLASAQLKYAGAPARSVPHLYALRDDAEKVVLLE